MSRSDRFGPPIAFKFADVGDKGEFTGFASTFGGPPDAYGDIIAPGAFTKTLAEHQAAGTMPAMLWAHDDVEPIGRWLEMREDSAGLRAKGRLTLDVQRARDARALMQDGAISLSIGYRVRASDRSGSGRILKDIQLFEVSTVAIPANPAARILTVKSGAASEIKDPRAFEEFLRDAGFPRAFARAVTASGFKAATKLLDGEEHQALAQFITEQTSEIQRLMEG